MGRFDPSVALLQPCHCEQSSNHGVTTCLSLLLLHPPVRLHRASSGSINALRNSGDIFARRASAAITRPGNEVNRSSIGAVNTDNNCERPDIDVSIGVVSGCINNAQCTPRRSNDTLTQNDKDRELPVTLL